MMQSLFKPAPLPGAEPDTLENPASQARRWAGRVMVATAVLFLLFDSIIKVRADGLGAILGTIELASLVLYAVPRTSVLGAILMTGFLGGSVATQARAGSPVLTQTLLPILIALLTWGGLLLRDGRLHPLVPARR
jgi:DoxX-like protein